MNDSHFVLHWFSKSDASRPSVDRALKEGVRLGIAPGGIAEMFEGYPKPNTDPNDEYTIVRKGLFRLAIKHNTPIVPVYCFGSTKIFRRLQLPPIIEKLSLLLRISIVVFFGQFGLPIPFRQKLLYVIGNPILPPSSASAPSPDASTTSTFAGGLSLANALIDQEQLVQEMQTKFCDELIRLFDRHKESYGWGQKQLITLKR